MESGNNEPKYRLMVENVGDLVFELDARGNFIYLSPAWESCFGIIPKEYVGRSFAPLVHPDDLPVCLTLLEEVVTTGRRGESGAYRVRVADGSWRWHQSTGAPVFEEDGRILCYVGVARDITELVETRAALQRTLSDREALFREYRHRVKNSFQMITSLIDYRILLQGDASPEDALSGIKTRVIALERLYTLLYSADGPLEVNLAEYCRTVTETLLDLSPGIERLISLEPVSVPAEYAGTVGLILVELLTNCVKYAFPVVDEGRIEITLTSRERQMSLTVADNGRGLPDDLSGSGMGMELVRGMVAKLGGTINLDSGEGTRIRLELPLP